MPKHPTPPDTPLSAPTVRLESFGCRVNKSDAAVLRGQLQARGYLLVEQPQADVIVFHSCTVTDTADQETFRALRQARRLAPQAHLVLTGCLAQVGGPELASSLGLSLVVPNTDRDALPDRLDALLQRPPLPSLAPTPDGGKHTRFFLKVQEGCEVRCAFCIVPDARGPSRSLPPDQVLSEVKAALARGHRELILSGIHLGGYGRDLPGRPPLSSLLRRILHETPLERLRLGSLEPWGLRPDLIALFRDEPRLLPSLPLPLQSGCAQTLRHMNRPITPTRFRSLVEGLLEARPELTLWLDLIAGFPGETEAHFAESLAFVESLPFTCLHVFPYSARQGTPAAARSDQVPDAIRQARAAQLKRLSQERLTQRLQARVGSLDSVLVERGARGHTRDNLPVQFKDRGMEAHRGEIVAVRLTGLEGGRLLAERQEGFEV